MSNDTQPEIRFPGFTEAWEQRKLSDVASIVGGGTPSTSNPEYWDGDIDWYAPAEIGDQIYVNKSLKTITELGQQKSSAKILPIGTVLFTSRAGIGNTAILAKEGTTNQGFQSIVPHENKLDSYFIFSRTHELKRYGEVTGAGSTFAEVSGKQMAKMPILIPYIDEQRKIGAFFGQIDEAIALHQRKLDLLKETKKGFLQKMFPKNGAKVPEIRFPGFTEDWEERRLQEVVDRYDNLRIPITASKRVAGNTPYYGANGIQGYVEGYTHDGEFILVAEDGANDLKNYPVQYVDGKVWVNNHAHVIQAKENLADNMFLMNAIRSINIEPFLVGGGRAKLNADVLMKLEVIIPLKSEQQKIGAFFKQLDDTIALHQRKLDLLKETKKGFLQKMFV
ncbi:restriction endonuclease subunit S [Enterococcus faecium]|uniref:restriction endonuclease subunit S n=1 Tax=Enterococcus faecium TaxID=1352 RepID=UPI000CF290BF|nr:restriction endonuclease subunit S [Enterococcus faecium]EGP5140842.1 restriction endonuclease subunit S [Enterococcus faecium]EGP5585319.1 restriction endonuclease subunit S [Enterococcus faecium]EME3547432.1 restriction endonuclease subunit S [Enterococcus faecium]EME3569884.1 restriction endonuclease subunit S [Enterococcus faecium]EMF0326474.1 restriction endonuclease subunit S [Enterococcus faecium]